MLSDGVQSMRLPQVYVDVFKPLSKLCSAAQHKLETPGSPTLCWHFEVCWAWVQGMRARREWVAGHNSLREQLLQVQVELTMNQPASMTDQQRTQAAASFQRHMQVGPSTRSTYHVRVTQLDTRDWFSTAAASGVGLAVVANQ